MNLPSYKNYDDGICEQQETCPTFRYILNKLIAL